MVRRNELVPLGEDHLLHGWAPVASHAVHAPRPPILDRRLVVRTGQRDYDPAPSCAKQAEIHCHDVYGAYPGGIRMSSALASRLPTPRKKWCPAHAGAN